MLGLLISFDWGLVVNFGSVNFQLHYLHLEKSLAVRIATVGSNTKCVASFHQTDGEVFEKMSRGAPLHSCSLNSQCIMTFLPSSWLIFIYYEARRVGIVEN